MGQPVNPMTVFTIGHSNHPLEVFLQLLERHRIGTVADVRSAPYSRFNPHFNRKALAAALAAQGIHYAWFGTELGGRPDDPACFENGRVNYERTARTERFRNGLRHLIDAMTNRRIAVMCAEREPLDCHRTLLVGHELDRREIRVCHILANGDVETHASAMDRLLAEYGSSPQGDLLTSRHESIARVIALKTGHAGS